MNTYVVEADRDDISYRSGEREQEIVFSVIHAPTRGKAKAMYCKRHGAAWTDPIHVYIVEKDVDAEQGYIDDNDAINECLYLLYERGTWR